MILKRYGEATFHFLAAESGDRGDLLDRELLFQHHLKSTSVAHFGWWKPEFSTHGKPDGEEKPSLKEAVRS